MRMALALAALAAVHLLAGAAWAEGGRSVGELVLALRAPAAADRAAAAVALAVAADPAASPALVAALRTDPSPEVRLAAALALGRLDSPEGRGALADAAAADPDAQVRATAAGLVRAPEPPAAPAPLSSPFGSPGPEAAPAPGPPPVVLVRHGGAPEPAAARARSARAMRISGWVLTGVMYGSALLTGVILAPIGAAIGSPATRDFGLMLMLPVIGPALAATSTWHGSGDDAALNVPFYLFTAIQATGVVLLAVGYARGREEPPARATAPGIVLAPAGPAGTAGLSLAGWF